MNLSRRGFLGGLLAVVSAPAIVRVGSLMTLPKPGIIRPTVEQLDVLYGYTRIRPEWLAAIPEFTLDEYSERILAPMVNQLAQNVADTIMHGQAATKYDLAGIRSIPLSELLLEARATNSHE